MQVGRNADSRDSKRKLWGRILLYFLRRCHLHHNCFRYFHDVSLLRALEIYFTGSNRALFQWNKIVHHPRPFRRDLNMWIVAVRLIADLYYLPVVTPLPADPSTSAKTSKNSILPFIRTFHLTTTATFYDSNPPQSHNLFPLNFTDFFFFSYDSICTPALIWFRVWNIRHETN